MLVVVLAVPALLGRAANPEPFDHSAVDQFQLDAPEIVFLGNSLLDTRIDPVCFSELTRRRTTSMAIDGVGPGIWNLQISNVIGEGAHHPDTVFLFFHDDLITRAISFTGVEDDSLVERLTRTDLSGYGNTSKNNASVGENIQTFLRKLYPAEANASDQHFVSSIGASIAGLPHGQFQSEAGDQFAFANKREQASIIQQPKFHGSFDSAISSSFLPSIIQTAQNLDIDLTIVRVAARPNDDGSSNEPDSLAKYSADLSEYLSDNDVRYVDMTGHPGIDAAMYYDGYHLKHRFQTFYTEFFAEWFLSAEVDSQ
jgi:hypothetical protein